MGNLLLVCSTTPQLVPCVCCQEGFLPLSHTWSQDLGGLSSSEVLTMDSLPEHLWAILNKGLLTILAAQRYHECLNLNRAAAFQLSLYSLNLQFFPWSYSLFYVYAAPNLANLSCSCAVSSASTQYCSSGTNLGGGKGESRGGSCSKVPEAYPTSESLPAHFKTDPLLGTTEPVSDAGRTSRIT